MSIEIPPEFVIEGVSRAFDRFLAGQPDLGEKLLLHMAELRCELLTVDEVAAMLQLSREVVRKNYREYGLDKSMALGPNEPRYFRSQVVAAMKRAGKVLNGQLVRVEATQASLAKKVTPFPRRHAPTIAAQPKEATP